MSLDVYLTEIQPTTIYSANITHNLGKSNKDATDWRTARMEPSVIEGDYSDRAISRLLRQIA